MSKQASYDDGLNDGRELTKWVANTILTNRMKQHSHGSKAYNALKEAREAILKSDDKVIACKSNLSDHYPTENEI